MNDSDSIETLRWPDKELAKKLLDKGLLTSVNLEKAIEACRDGQKYLAEAIVGLNLLSRQVVYEEMAGIHGVPFIELQNYGYDPMVLSLIDEAVARELDVFPLFTIGESLTIAVTDPGDITVVDRVTAVTGHSIQTCLAARDDIREALNRAYGGHGEVKAMLATMEDGYVAGAARTDALQRTPEGDESPVSRLVNLILTQSLRDRASDIHIDPEQNNLKIRFRIDGVLYDIPPPPKHLHPFIISRIKVMSNMDIAESRIPQDGSFKTTIEGRSIEARVSSMPTIYGENIAIRLLDTDVMNIELENLGISDAMLPTIAGLIRRPHGMVVITGPTGSGKSTTLYAMLSKARSPERHIITIEDPVERRIEMVTQIQVNERAELTFANALRSMLRQDPDVMMVGEIRDQETAQLAVRAALTGHLVLTTAHTNDAASVVTRLTNMDIEPFLVASALSAAIGQRLCRCICGECRAPYQVPGALRKRLLASGITLPDSVSRGKGCSSCRNTGYSGRIGVFELMPVTPEVANLIASNVPAAQLKAQARKDGMATMLEDGLQKIAAGKTTIEEVLRIVELENVVDSKPSAAKPKPAGKEQETGKKIGGRPEASLDIEDYKKKMENWLARQSR